MVDDAHSGHLSQDRSAGEWQPRGRDFDAEQYREALLAIFAAVRDAPAWDQHALMRILARHPRDSKGYFSKIELVSAYQQLTAAGTLPFERVLQRRLQMKPVRTSSGVAPVTVLTEPAVWSVDDAREALWASIRALDAVGVYRVSLVEVDRAVSCQIEVMTATATLTTAALRLLSMAHPGCLRRCSSFLGPAGLIDSRPVQSAFVRTATTSTLHPIPPQRLLRVSPLGIAS